MPNSSMKKVEQDREKVLNAILADPSVSAAQVAERCGLSKQQVWRTLRYLEENDIVRPQSVVVDPTKISKKRYLILMERIYSLTDMEEEPDDIIGNKLNDTMKEWNIKAVIEDSYFLGGNYDWAIILLADDIADAKKFCDLYRKTYPKCLVKFNMIEVLFTLRRNGRFNQDLDRLKSLML